MSLAAYNRTFFSFLGVGLLSLIAMLALALIAPQHRREEKRMLATVGMTAFGFAFAFNAACGIQHKKMRARWSVATLENSGRSFYWFDIPANVVIAGMLFGLAIQTWRGVVPISL